MDEWLYEIDRMLGWRVFSLERGGGGGRSSQHPLQISIMYINYIEYTHEMY